MKRPGKKQNNRGFSLVEILVTMLVIAIVSIPIIRTFLVTANVNLKTKRIQNATDTAQNVAEYFSSVDLDKLMATYQYTKDSKTGTLVFENVGDGSSVDQTGASYYKGASGEKYYVTVVMNPKDYSSLDGTGINDYVIPSLENVYGSSNVTAFSQFTKYDNRILNAFLVNKGVTATYADIKKKSYVHIAQTQNGTGVDYAYYLTVTYTYCTHNGNNLVETNKSISYDFTLGNGTLSTTEKSPDLYLVYPAFDIFDSNHISPYARDEIYVYYQEKGIQSYDKPVNVFLIQQDVKHSWDSFQTVGVDANKLFISSYGRIPVGGVVDYTSNKDAKLTVFSNITNWPTNSGITVGSNSMTTLYTMDVYIRYDKKDGNDPNAYFTGTQDQSDLFTSVSTVKED